MRHKKKLVLLVIPVAVGLGLFYWFYWRAEDDPNVLSVSGSLEVTDVEVSFKIPGWVEGRGVSEGETVEAGEEVASLDRRELEQEVEMRRAQAAAAEAQLAELLAGSRREEVARAKAAVDRAQAQLDLLTAGSRPQEKDTALAKVQKAEAETEQLRRDYERQKELFASHVVARREYERAETAYQTARAQVREAREQMDLVQEGPRAEEIEQARASLAEARAQYELVKEGPRPEAIDRAQAKLEEARQALAMTETKRVQSTIRAPISGLVLQDHVEPGEYVMPGTPVVTIGDLRNIWMRAYIAETDLGRVKVGQAVRVYTDTYPGKAYTGRVTFVASEAEFTPKSVQTEEERVKLVYRIKVELENPDMELKPGMPADAKIRVGAEDA